MLSQGMQCGRHRRNGTLKISNVCIQRALCVHCMHIYFLFCYRLYEKLGEHDHAAKAYTDFVTDEFRSVDRTELSHAYKYLTQYYLKKEQLDEANLYAQKCLQFDETKEEAKVLLRTIAEKRAKVEETSMVVSKIIL